MEPATQVSPAEHEASPPLLIDVVSDVVCPWCYIGKRKLEAALGELRRAEPGLDARVRWHPFQLNPELPASGIPRSDYLEAKFGSGSRAAEITRECAPSAQRSASPSTSNASSSAQYARRSPLDRLGAARGDAQQRWSSMFQRYFIEGGLVGHREELAASAAAIGLPGEEAQLLASDVLRDEVERRTAKRTRRGIAGVPFFIFNGRTAVAGAHDPPALLEAIAAARVVMIR
jgi:predicted DsbA family dithiol-disulfide isomerase